jgi:hypothetical protein
MSTIGGSSVVNKEDSVTYLTRNLSWAPHTHNRGLHGDSPHGALWGCPGVGLSHAKCREYFKHLVEEKQYATAARWC